MMLRFVAWVLLLLSNYSSTAQFRISTISLNSADDFYTYRFPNVTGQDSAISQKINRYLQQQVLSNEEVLTSSGKIFEGSRYIDSISQTGYTSIDYTIGANNKNILSIAFELETLAAYPEHFADYYNFDTRTGEVISLKEIITKEGFQYLLGTVRAQRKQRVAKFIKENYALSEDSLYIREQYADCLSENELGDMFIRQSTVLFHQGYCFPHVARPYDTDLDIEIRTKQLKAFLTAYGRKLLEAQ